MNDSNDVAPTSKKEQSKTIKQYSESKLKLSFFRNKKLKKFNLAHS